MTKEELKKLTIKARDNMRTSCEVYVDYLNIIQSLMGDVNPLCKRFYRLLEHFSKDYYKIYDELVNIIKELPDDETNQTKS